MKILVGYDGSNQSKGALELARKHALAFSAKIYVVTSLFGEKETTPQEVEAAEEGLEYARNSLTDAGIDVETHLLIRGVAPGEDLVQFARENNVDQIVVGVKKVSPVGKLIFGSNARHVILNAPCPVLSVR
ncbi:MAG: universal stress protein [Desulfomonile tiedjei]|uniref:Universal stress protein n=1 Tax=Desulfomonile tiedjei TaxID=2358 RepID=A0A9D6YYQ2_9BACT|nr:universal stress protein [Desulfomonile tiedjei]